MAASWVLLKAFRNFQMSSIGRRNRTSVSTYNRESTSFRMTWYQKKYLVTVSNDQTEKTSEARTYRKKQPLGGTWFEEFLPFICIPHREGDWIYAVVKPGGHRRRPHTELWEEIERISQCHDCQPSVNCTSSLHVSVKRSVWRNLYQSKRTTFCIFCKICDL